MGNPRYDPSFRSDNPYHLEAARAYEKFVYGGPIIKSKMPCQATPGRLKKYLDAIVGVFLVNR